MKNKELDLLEDDIDAALHKASGLGLELVVYILTMAKLELANEVGDRRLTRSFDPKPVSLQ
jgi:hypothetical protein